MQAMVVNAFGDPEVLRAQEIGPRRLRGCDVLVCVHATSVNLVDLSVRRGEHAVSLPAVLGHDISGVVEAVGADVEDFAVGDEVFYMTEVYASDGSYAEYNVAPERIVARKPANLSHHEAAGLPLAAGTAWEALIGRGALALGETLLVLGDGAVGLFAVQLGRAAGAQVFAVCRPEMAALVRRLGADRTIDAALEDYTDVIWGESPGSAVDVVLDTVDGNALRRSMGVTRAHGRVLSTVAATGDAGEALARNITHHFVSVVPDRARLNALCALAERGQLVPVIDSVLPLSEATAAHRRAEGGGLRGTLVLDVVPEP